MRCFHRFSVHKVYSFGKVFTRPPHLDMTVSEGDRS
jgi:hypothetical protein